MTKINKLILNYFTPGHSSKHKSFVLNVFRFLNYYILFSSSIITFTNSKTYGQKMSVWFF